MRGLWWCVVLALTIGASPAPSATPLPTDPAVRMAATISQKDLDAIYAVLYTTIRRAKFILRPANQMPPGDPLVHFDRIDGGHPLIWVERSLVRRAPGPDLTRGNDSAVAATGALALAAIELGSAGAAWKARLDRTPDRAVLSHAIGIAFADRSDRQISQARTDVAWVHAHLKPGTIDGEAYRLLVGHHLPVVRSSRDLLVGYSLGFNAGCMNEMLQRITFNDDHRLTTITETTQQRCQ
jgi:hypothetical protein